MLAVLVLLSYLYLPFFALSSFSGSLTYPSRIDVYAQGLVLNDGCGGARAVRWEQVNYWLRAVGAGLAVVAIWVYVWRLVLPAGEPSVVGQLPSDSHSLSAACVGKGTAYSSAAAYAGRGPHPIIVFSSDSDVSFPARWTPGNTATIQLVACVNRDGNATFSDIALCFSEQVFVDLAEYQVTVYELRTHRELGSARVVGQDTTCPQEQPVLDPYSNRSL